MEVDIKKLDEVWTADDKKLGLATAVYHRKEGVDPQLKFYASYLYVESFDYGDEYYVPTEFIASRDPQTGRVKLSVKLQKVLEYTWSRMPDFVAAGKARQESLVPA